MIATFTIQQPTLLATLRAVPSARVIWEQSDTTANGEHLLMFWAETSDVESFEAALHHDSTVTAPRVLTTTGDRRLYQVEHVGEGRAQSVYPTIVEAGGIVQQGTGTYEGWTLQVELPDTDALRHIHEWCSCHDLEFTLKRKYEQTGSDGNATTYGLTEKQRTLLVRATQEGYFDVPRGTDLNVLAAELNISHQAASERLRRGIDLLVQHTVLDDERALQTLEQ
ncbi:bacterio-opsin activator domain-containing protein [Halomarina rubra]|uniref:Bacterio-opsin activator domain-containing protein n=1 Tax=Halomarina rubra TaxID=2071873 RepID=A0ABD6AYH9_9EURY|nr:bacterio-opsin activator domain-containing protein [Halomarina rubra]